MKPIFQIAPCSLEQWQHASEQGQRVNVQRNGGQRWHSTGGGIEERPEETNIRPVGKRKNSGGERRIAFG